MTTAMNLPPFGSLKTRREKRRARLLRQVNDGLEELASGLDIQPTPEDLDGDHYGRKPRDGDGGVCTFICQLFHMNELFGEVAPYLGHEKMSDAEIERQIRIKYPDAKLTKRFDRETDALTVNSLRQQYNSGNLLGRRKTNARFSHRYDAKGRIVDGRFGRRPLTPEEIEALQARSKMAAERVYIRRATRLPTIEWWYGDKHGISVHTNRRRKALKRVLEAQSTQGTDNDSSPGGSV